MQLGASSEASRRDPCAHIAALRPLSLGPSRAVRPMSSYRERRRQRYARDPEYRQRVIAFNRTYRAAHRTAILEAARQRYASDPEYRRKVLEYNRARRSANPARARRRAHRYGLSWEELEAMSARQGGACAICRQKPARGLVIDHCHLRKKVRRLLCDMCNLGLGHFRDDPRLLQAAIEYIVTCNRDEMRSRAQ
jgi:Recombination endonuclease VII